MTVAAARHDDIQAKIEHLERLRRLRVAAHNGSEPWEPYPHQIVPDGDWYLWLLLAGRGAGKTDGCAAYFDSFMRRNPGARGGIIGPTLGDVAEACVYGVSGLFAHNPLLKVRSRAGGTYVMWPNSSEAKLFGAYTKEDVERLRAGGNRHLYWLEELAAWRHIKEAWENMELGLRLGKHPHVIASTTPKPRPFLKTLMESDETILVRATIHDNPKLPQSQRDRLVARYKGTRLERQELLGEFIEDVEGALWTYELIHKTRRTPAEVPDLVRVVVGVDPSGGDEEGNDEQGIIVAGRSADDHYYITHDRSCKLTPDGWGKRAVKAYLDSRADRIVGETNFGGAMVLHVVKTAAADMGVDVVAKKMTASRGKTQRAEPVAMLFEQGRAHIVGDMPELESQMRNWTDDSGWSPDRMDAMVWAVTELNEGHKPAPMRTYVPRGRMPTAADRFLDI